jgi:hypothetical protein
VVVTVVTAVTLLAGMLVVLEVLVVLEGLDVPPVPPVPDVPVPAGTRLVLVEVDVDVETGAPFDVVGGSGAPGRWVGLQPESESDRGRAMAATAHAARARDLLPRPKGAHRTTRSVTDLGRARARPSLTTAWPSTTGPITHRRPARPHRLWA